MSNVTSGGEECYRERRHGEAGGCVCTGGVEVGANKSPHSNPVSKPCWYPLSCLTLDSVRTQTVYKEGVHAS